MTHYVGLDVSMNTTFICIVDEKDKIVKELESASTPEAMDSFLSETGLQIEKVGLKAAALPII